ncbi:chemokine-like protein TAFA-5 isoform X2 [Carcharodon carcharias]|uniref:chemokine-like protein TAFA-5 isoform X2 n=1 Tax=Carcharodon carcharias TaxID=13397 RepID=UPI001B7E87B4|nr:chemokine-like protein TAFA-5 isoform X2 [Carcharodon carcharias]
MPSTFWFLAILSALLIAFCNFQQLQYFLFKIEKDTGQLAVGTCEIVTLDRDSSQPRRTIARQTARCACRRGQIAGTTRAKPACVDVRVVKSKQWCEMIPCSEGEICGLLMNKSGWTCTQPGGRIKTITTQPFQCTTDRAVQGLKDIAARLGLQQVVRQSRAKNILDLILTNLTAVDASVQDIIGRNDHHPVLDEVPCSH